MALATLDGLVFRINPNTIKWNFNINTSVTETLGGRVVQVLGATLSDLVVGGDFGQDHSRATDGLSWKMAVAFLTEIERRMNKQSTLTQSQGQQATSLPTLSLTFPDYGWHFGVYVKAISSRGADASIAHTVGSFNYGYRLTFFIVEDRTDTVTQKASDAVAAYITRISAGVGWKESTFNDPSVIQNAISGNSPAGTTGTTARPSTSPVSSTAAGNKAGRLP